MNTHRAGSFVLLAGGLVLVFAGLSTALGFSLAGMLASAAAIAALLYAGAVWFGEAPRVDPSLVLFTPSMIVASGPLTGRPVADAFPDPMRRDIETACRAALNGRTSKFSCGSDAGSRIFEASPVKTADGVVVYGLLLSGALVPAVTPAGMTTVV